MEPYNAIAVANYFIDRAKAASSALTPMKLQKLIYFAHGWHIAIYGEPLINEEMQAWDYGPVVSSVYHEFKNYGSTPIDKYATDFDLHTLEIITPRIPLDDKRTIALIDKVGDVYEKYNGIQLSNLTHEPTSAWSIVRKSAGNAGMRSVGIPNSAIKTEFDAKKAKLKKPT